MLELHVLAALRQVHGVRMRVIRHALDYLQTRLGVARPLIDEQMHTDGRTILVRRLDPLIDAGHGGQASMLALLDVHLDRISAVHASAVSGPSLPLGPPRLAGNSVAMSARSAGASVRASSRRSCALPVMSVPTLPPVAMPPAPVPATSTVNGDRTVK